MGAGLFWPAATLAPAAACWMNRPARPSLPGRLTRWGSWPLGWRECGSPVPGGLAQRANVRRTWRIRFTMTSSWAGRGGGRPSQLTPLLAVAALFTTRDRPQDCPQESAHWALLVVAGTPGTDRVAAAAPGRRRLRGSGHAAAAGSSPCLLARRQEMAMAESAPAAIPATRHGTFRCALTPHSPPGWTCSATRSCSPRAGGPSPGPARRATTGSGCRRMPESSRGHATIAPTGCPLNRTGSFRNSHCPSSEGTFHITFAGNPANSPVDPG